MKIVYLTAGAANMFCGTCLHDNTLAAALIDAGHDVLLTPLYTPTRTDEPNVSGSRVFFSGINVYLQQKSWLFRHTPWLVDRAFESPWLLNKLVGRASATAPEQLGDLTVSMLHGEQGRQSKELAKLIDWLRHEQPDIVHLSNCLLLGVAREIRRELSVPVVCSLSGEDIFLEHIPEPHYSQARDALRERCRAADVLLAMNQYCADFMADYLDVSNTHIQVIRHGLNLDHFQTAEFSDQTQPPTFGYFARICPDKGLHVLVDAAKQLAAQPSPPVFRIRAAGYVGQLDRPYLDQLIRTAAEPPAVDFEYLGELDLAAKVRFLSSLDAMALPTVYHETKGISALEALAVATPIIVPDHGVFPELIADTGGGVLFASQNPTALADQLAAYLADSDQAAARGRHGQTVIQTHYTASRMARQTLALYRQLTSPAPKTK